MDKSLFPANIYSSVVNEKEIYFFEENCPYGIQAHPHVCLKKAGKVFFFSVISSRLGTIDNLLKDENYVKESLPEFQKTKFNKLSKDSYVDCNYTFEIPEIELNDLIQQGIIHPFNESAKFSDNEFEQILNGIKSSLIIEEYLKEILLS